MVKKTDESVSYDVSDGKETDSGKVYSFHSKIISYSNYFVLKIPEAVDIISSCRLGKDMT